MREVNANGSVGVHASATLQARALVGTARPRQWVKNVLVFAAPGAAGVLTRWPVLVRVCEFAGVFLLASMATYFINDTADAAADALHPRKCHRPIASGALSRPAGAVIGAGLACAGVGAAEAMGPRIGLLVTAYLVLQVAYSLWLKHHPVVDLGAVVAGFVLRAVGGGVAAGVKISPWFIVVALFGALVLVTGKRLAEHVDLGAARGAHRRSLVAYTESSLRGVLFAAVGVTLTSYCLWALEKQRALPPHSGPVWYELSIAPFAFAVLHYGLMVGNGRGGQPEVLLLRDPAILAAGLVWALLFGLGVYAG